MAKLVESLAKQRRFRWLLIGLIAFSLLLGLLIVPVERGHEAALITTYFDGVWWAFTTITSVGYGDVHPVTHVGKVMGMVLEVIGVLSFGLLIGMITVALDDAKNRFYWKRVFERLDALEKRLGTLEKQSDFVVKNEIHSDLEE